MSSSRSTQARNVSRPGGGPSPPPEQCVRIATNQIGPSGTHFEPPLVANESTVAGAVSTASGTFNSFVYQPFGENSLILQQYVVLKDVTGNFIDDEELTWIV